MLKNETSVGFISKIQLPQFLCLESHQLINQYESKQNLIL